MIRRSVAYALLEGASEALGIKRSDIDGTLYYQPGRRVPSIILYDDVSGGAGHVKVLSSHFWKLRQLHITV